MDLKQLEKLINERHYKDDPVIIGMLELLKVQSKEIIHLSKRIELIIKTL